MKKSIFNQKGFSLLEAVMAVIILAIGFFSTQLLLENISISAIGSDRNVIATQLANEKLENILADKVFRGFSYVDNSQYPVESLSGPYNGYKRKVSVTEVQSTDLLTPLAGSGLKRVLVTVSWGATAAERIVVTGMVAKYN